jgi:hypothetical protein
MYTPSADPTAPAFFEFPDFGFGPASTSIVLLEATIDDRNWQVVSTGSALRFCREHLPGLVYHDLDTSTPAAWDAFRLVAPRGSLVMSNTNPEFAVWALQQGYDVGIVDTLDWMWNELPHELNRAQFHLVQAFFGGYRSAARAAGMHPREIGPIVVSGLHKPESPGEQDGGHVVIGFGGMHVPFDEGLATSYTAWFLDATLPVLLDEHTTDRLTLVAGHRELPELVPSRWARDPRLDVRTGMSRTDYARLLRSAGHVLVAPGLTTLFECAHGRLQPFLQPGFNMSMVLQSHQVRATGYSYVAVWPWLIDATQELASLPEAEGVALVSAHLRRIIQGDETDWLLSALRAYLERDQDIGPLDLPVRRDLPSAVEAFRAAVGAGVDLRA